MLEQEHLRGWSQQHWAHGSMRRQPRAPRWEPHEGRHSNHSTRKRAVLTRAPTTANQEDASWAQTKKLVREAAKHILITEPPKSRYFRSDPASLIETRVSWSTHTRSFSNKKKLRRKERHGGAAKIVTDSFPIPHRPYLSLSYQFSRLFAFWQNFPFPGLINESGGDSRWPATQLIWVHIQDNNQLQIDLVPAAMGGDAKHF